MIYYHEFIARLSAKTAIRFWIPSDRLKRAHTIRSKNMAYSFLREAEYKSNDVRSVCVIKFDDQKYRLRPVSGVLRHMENIPREQPSHG